MSDLPVGATLTAAEVARRCGLAHAPTPEQAAVIESPLEPSLVVAGAGSGKTETMSARVVWLVANGLVQPNEVLGLTFTRKAAAELSDRIGQRLRRLEQVGLWSPVPDEDGTDVLGAVPTVSTYHSYAGRLVREHALRLGYEPDSRLLSEAAAWQYAAEAVAAYDEGMDEVAFEESTVIGAVIDLATEMAEHLVTTDELRVHLDEILAAIDATPQAPRTRARPVPDVTKGLLARRGILPIIERYHELKRQRDAMDFADQMAIAARLARDFPDVVAGERARFKVVLLDEFQDTSEAQLILLRELFATGAHSRPVTAVGDPHQSIYGWRGASASTLSRFPQEFPRTDGRPARVLQLSTSWRNDEAILAVANAVSEPLRSQSTVEVAQLAPRPGAGPGVVEVARLLTQQQEAEHVAAWVAEHRAGGLRSAAVLCRKRSQFIHVVEALERAGLPIEVVGLGGLLMTPEVEDVVAALRVVADPSRGDALMRLLTGPSCRLGPADLDGLMAWARHTQRLRLEHADRVPDAGARAGAQVELSPDAVDTPSIGEALDSLPPSSWRGRAGERVSAPALERLTGLSLALARLRTLTALPLADLAGEVERVLGLDIEVLARPEYSPAAARAHLDAFADVAAGFTSSADRPTLTGFLAWLDAAVEQERGLDKGYIEASSDAVQVLTVHAAKGLEWDLVAVPGLVETIFPDRTAGKPSHDGHRWSLREPKVPGWATGPSGLPYALRGDGAELPVFEWTDAADTKELTARLEEFKEAAGAHAMAEERRLAYVALTRARQRLLVTAPVWADGTSFRMTSRFLRELVDEQADLEVVPKGDQDAPLPRPSVPGVVVTRWQPLPDPDDAAAMTNPLREEGIEVIWPVPPEQARLHRMRVAERAVHDALARALGPSAADRSEPGERVDHEIDMLLAERDAALDRGSSLEVLVPRHLSASGLVALADDPQRFALSLRRPMPAPPALAARRGTAFHAWVEQHYAQAAFLDADELPGSADDDADLDADLPRMKELFLASEWSARQPALIEQAVETVISGVAIRGRIDAIFTRADEGFTIVDWKTGAKPTGRAAAIRTLQLATYAIAFARWKGIDPATVDAAFYYAQSGETVRPQLPGEDEVRAVLAQVADDQVPD